MTSGTAVLAASACVSGLFIAVAHSLPHSTSGDVRLVTGLPPIMEFDMGAHSASDAIVAESGSSRQGAVSYLNAVSLIEEWLTMHLTALLQSPYPDVVVASIQASLELAQHPAFAYARYQVC